MIVATRTRNLAPLLPSAMQSIAKRFTARYTHDKTIDYLLATYARIV